MSTLQLRTQSFRTRLRLFFVVIVVVPMLTLAVVLFQLIVTTKRSQTDARLAASQTVSQEILRELETEAGMVADRIGRDQGLANALRTENKAGIQRRLDRLTDQAEARYVALELDGVGGFEAGAPPGLAPAGRRLEDEDARSTGRLTVALVAPEAYANRIAKLTRAYVVVDGDDRRLASTHPTAPAELPGEGGTTLDGTDLRVRAFDAPATGGEVTVRLLMPDQDEADPTGKESVAAAVAFVAFVAFAFIFAVTVSRRLQSEIQRLLVAAQRLGSGDFSVTVPAEGNDEFSALGKEFNSMARQLEARLEELQRERGRLQEAIRRVGESFAAGLDRVGLLDIVVQTAVDGIGASAGRATIRDAAGKLQEVARTGQPETLRRALHAAEAAVIDAGQIAEIQVGGASALAAPLGASENGDQVIGIVSVARGDRAFTHGERELFAYLTNQASVSVENVDLHETVQKQAVTDELTGLFNHRRFQEVMTAEVERARRYGHELGLIMLDIDNFKAVNDTYGHLTGDNVLRAVARVLRQSSRDVDEPARYGGEEMAVALPQTDLEGAYQFAERVRGRIEALELPVPNGEGTFKVTASFGVASLSTAEDATKSALVAAADAALYEAKRSGKNRTVRASGVVSSPGSVHGVASGE